MKICQAAAHVCLLVVLLIATTSAQQPEVDARIDDAPATPATGRDKLLRAYELGKSAEDIEDFSEIISLCEQGLTSELSEAFAIYGKDVLAWAHWKRGIARVSAAEPDQQQALADFEDAVKFDSETSGDRPAWRYLHDRGVSYAGLGETDKALADFNRVIQLRPDYGKEYFNRGEVHMAAGDFERAVEDFLQAQRRGFNEPLAYMRCGFAAFLLGDTRRAISQYGLAISRDPRDYETLTLRGDACAASGDYNRALSDYQQALELNPRYSQAMFGSAWLRSTCPVPEYRNPRIALRNAQSVIEIDGENHLFHYRNLEALAAAQALAGQFEQAEKTQKAALAAAPPNADRSGMEERLELYGDGRPYFAERPRDGYALAPR